MRWGIFATRIPRPLQANRWWIQAILYALAVVLLGSCDVLDGRRSSTGPDQNGCEGGNHTMTFVSQTLISAASGGVFSFRAGTLTVRAGSIPADTVIQGTVRVTQCDVFRNEYEFAPSGLRFDPPATLALSYGMMSGADLDTVTLMLFDEQTGEWVVAAEMARDPSGHRYVGEISHFSRYSLSANGQSARPAP
ncbi:MAG: hypothetical protein HYV63_05495 [Candidatus Schekmanbacteria bacterium]|nr:hypothetical protein [Candidatus Schekmanbacteria bacterium]